MEHVTISVLRGGQSIEYDISMLTGASVLNALTELGYNTRDIVITRNGEWLESGLVKRPEAVLLGSDLVFVALHGTFGEAGEIQRMLEVYKVPFTGTRSLSSSIAFNKAITKDLLRGLNVSLPKHHVVKQVDLNRLGVVTRELNLTLGEELFVKPAAGGFSIGAKKVVGQDSLHETLETLLKQHEKVLVEEFIRGKEVSVSVIENFRDLNHYSLPAVELVPPAHDPILSYENKYNGSTTEICPGRFSYREKSLLEQTACEVHRALQCNHYSKSDFVLKDGVVYFLEINTLPDLRSESVLAKAAASIGLTYNQVVEHFLNLAYAK